MVSMLQSLFGILVLVAFAHLFRRQHVVPPWRMIGVSLAMQFLIALLFFRISYFQHALTLLNSVVTAIDAATRAGTSMVFGFLGGGPEPYPVSVPAHNFVLAFRALPIVLVFSVLSALLWHWRILQWIIRGFALVLEKSFRLGGAVGFGSASSIFVGMVEAPLLVRPYLRSMSDGEVFVLMSCGMATVAGTVMGLYAMILTPHLPDALGHILIASVISAPAAIMYALIMRPVTSLTQRTPAEEGHGYHSTMDAISKGTSDGLQLLLMVMAMLIVFVALVALVNQVLGALPVWQGEPVTLQRLLGYLFAPVAWLMGIPWQEAQTAGQLLGTKTILNELLAYIELSQLDAAQISDRSRLILTYALCGFANFGSLGILVGGMTAMCPERREDILKLAPLSLVSGTLATCTTGAIVGLLVPAMS